MAISPQVSETLVHRHVLLWDLPCRALALVVLVSHENDWIYGREKENCYRVSAGGEEQRNSCEWRCVQGQSHRLVFEDMKQRGGRIGARKRQPQLMEGEAPLH